MTLRTLSPGENIHLICLPPAGGASQTFLPLARALPASWRVSSIDPPGHASNRAPLVREFEDLVSFYLDEVHPVADDQTVVFGHSIGGLAGYRVTQEIERRRGSLRHLIVSASFPPHRVERDRLWNEMCDEDVLEDVRSLGGPTEELLHLPEYIAYILPILKADSRILGTFRNIEPAPPRTPILVLGGTRDAHLPVETLRTWTEACPEATVELLEGPHMFLHTALDVLVDRLLVLLDPGSRKALRREPT